MFKIALSAGHGKNTLGKRCLKKIDKKETREWVLNSRICDLIEKELQNYSDCSVIRLDDKTGKKDVSITNRTNKANKEKADIYISVHHNAGIKGGSGGGIMAFTYLKVSKKTEELQKLLYKKLIEKTGLKGNRGTPLSKANFGELRQSNMPAVLLECGFMDSTTDTPIILTKEFAEKCALAISEAIIETGKLKLKQTAKKLYCVQVGAFSSKENAEELADKLKKAGFDAVIK